MIDKPNTTPPAVNEYGVPYATLLVRQQAHADQLLASYREALLLWRAAYEAPPHSRQKRQLIRQAMTRMDKALA